MYPVEELTGPLTCTRSGESEKSCRDGLSHGGDVGATCPWRYLVAVCDLKM